MTMHAGYDDMPISAAESTRHSWELEQTREAREHDLKIRAQELEILKRETSWGIFLRLPMTIILLPVYVVMGCGFIVAMARGKDVSENFWKLFK